RRHTSFKCDWSSDVCSSDLLQRHLVFREVDSLVLFEFIDDPVDDPLVDVVAAKVRITVRGLHLDDAFANLEDGNIERTAAKIVKDRKSVVKGKSEDICGGLR